MRTEAIVVPLLTGLAAYAQELKIADGIFNFSTAKMTNYKTWSGDIVQTMNMFGSEVTTKGSITQKQPRKMRMQMDMTQMGGRRCRWTSVSTRNSAAAPNTSPPMSDPAVDNLRVTLSQDYNIQNSFDLGEVSGMLSPVGGDLG